MTEDKSPTKEAEKEAVEKEPAREQRRSSEDTQKFSRDSLVRSAAVFNVRQSDMAGALALSRNSRDRNGTEQVYTRDDVKEALKRWKSEPV